MRVLQFIATAALALLCALAPARADKRVALVIGNAAYRHADRLANPVNDARGMRDALTGLGFDVTYGEDLDLKALRQKVGQFAGRRGDADQRVAPRQRRAHRHPRRLPRQRLGPRFTQAGKFRCNAILSALASAIKPEEDAQFSRSRRLPPWCGRRHSAQESKPRNRSR